MMTKLFSFQVSATIKYEVKTERDERFNYSNTNTNLHHHIE